MKPSRSLAHAASAVVLVAALLALTVGMAPQPAASARGHAADVLVDPVRQAAVHLQAGTPLNALPVAARSDGGGSTSGGPTGGVALPAALWRPDLAPTGSPRALPARTVRTARPGALRKLLCTYRL